MAAILSTSLAVPVTDWAARWQLVNVTGVQIGQVCIAESELAQVTAVGPATTITVRRGVEGTAATPHVAGTPVAVYRATDDVVTADAPLGVAAAPLRQVTVTLTNAQFLATWDVPHVIVPAPGPNKLIVPMWVTFLSAFRLPYTGGSTAGGEVALEYSGGGTVAHLVNIGVPPSDPDIQFHTFLTTINSVGEVFFTHLAVPQLLKAVSTTDILIREDTMSTATKTNKALVLELFSHLAGGDPTDRLAVTVLYHILDVTTGVWV